MAAILKPKDLKYKQVEKAHFLEFVSDYDGLTYSYEELKEAESQGYAKGYGDGLDLGITTGENRALRENDIALNHILEEIKKQINIIAELEKHFHENFFSTIVKICHAVLEKTMPHFFIHGAKEELAEVLKQVIQNSIIKVPIKIEISEEMYDFTTKKASELSEQHKSTIEVIKSKNVSDHACLITWDGGGAKWDINIRLEEIKKLLEEYEFKTINGGEA